MKIIKPSFEIINEPNWDTVLTSLEKPIRLCYKSEDKIKPGSAEKIIRNIIKRGHESTLEHVSMSVKFICDRGVTHEMVRHRHCSFSQESTRYVNYKDKPMEFILPCWMDIPLGTYDAHCEYEHAKSGPEKDWYDTMLNSEFVYNDMIEAGWSPQKARSILPNSLKTEIVVTTNLRDWRHILHLRCDTAAHPQYRELSLPLYDALVEKCPVIFDSIEFNR